MSKAHPVTINCDTPDCKSFIMLGHPEDIANEKKALANHGWVVRDKPARHICPSCIGRSELIKE